MLYVAHIAPLVFELQRQQAEAAVAKAEQAGRKAQAAHIEELVQQARAARNADAEYIEFREVRAFVPPPMLAAPELPKS